MGRDHSPSRPNRVERRFADNMAETTVQAIATLDEKFPWLLGAEVQERENPSPDVEISSEAA
jgi:hypothetical protein